MPMADAEEDGRCNELFVRILFFLWIVLLIPWVVFVPLSAMAVDAGYNIPTLLFILSTWSFGIAVFGAFKFFHRSRKAVLLPFLSIGGMLFSDFLNRITPVN